ncbi:hypothetical protein D4764_16G0009840 [Takifugu flavidus]|uniref:Uncharacterized protein n=1 Tax=Takifugu flavidus TaxID=433684 RepID=A0A5C6P352_9TELE|nr:hypothetical protein D4764_16G0009840 [Takifugu flavidus]
MAGPGQEEGRVQPPQRETRYHGNDKLKGSREPDARLETQDFLLQTSFCSTDTRAGKISSISCQRSNNTEMIKSMAPALEHRGFPNRPFTDPTESSTDLRQ